MFVSQSTTKLCNYFLISSTFSTLCIYRYFDVTESLFYIVKFGEESKPRQVRRDWSVANCYGHV
jgi:hypothetical protein